VRRNTLSLGCCLFTSGFLHLQVAIKITDKKHKSVNEYILTHLHREARLLKRLRHPNIVQAFEVMETDSKFYLVQELCPKGDLMRYVEHGGPLSEKETRKYMRQLVSAIDYLHQASILHRYRLVCVSVHGYCEILRNLVEFANY